MFLKNHFNFLRMNAFTTRANHIIYTTYQRNIAIGFFQKDIAGEIPTVSFLCSSGLWIVEIFSKNGVNGSIDD